MSDVHAAENAEVVTTIDPSIEVEAKDYGWAPQEEFKGPKDKWRPADEYLTWARQSGRLKKGEFDDFRKQFPAIRQENQALKSELTEIKQTLNQFVEFSSKAEERAFGRARQELEAKVESAAANADPVAARAALKDLEALAEPPKPRPVQQQQAPQLDPVIQDWLAKEPWFSPKNPSLYGFATGVFEELKGEKPGMSTQDILAETKRRTVEIFPDKFGVNPRRETAASVSAPNGGGSAPRKRGKGYEDLPADAKRACDRFVRTIKGYTKEQYVKDFDWDN